MVNKLAVNLVVSSHQLCLCYVACLVITFKGVYRQGDIIVARVVRRCCTASELVWRVELTERTCSAPTRNVARLHFSAWVLLAHAWATAPAAALPKLWYDTVSQYNTYPSLLSTLYIRKFCQLFINVNFYKKKKTQYYYLN